MISWIILNLLHSFRISPSSQKYPPCSNRNGGYQSAAENRLSTQQVTPTWGILGISCSLENQHVEPKNGGLEDDVPDLNWVIVRFQVNFQGCKNCKKTLVNDVRQTSRDTCHINCWSMLSCQCCPSTILRTQTLPKFL